MASREYFCSICDKSFGNSGHLYRHQLTHSAEKPIPCSDPTCNQTFARADNMRRHAAKHVPPEDYQFVCNVPDCGKRFPSKENFRRHSKTHDEKNWRYQCPHCERMFTKKHQRVAHLYHAHQVPMPYRCEVDRCDEQFLRKCDVDLHFKRKHVPKEFFCLHEECVDLPAFDKLPLLNLHMRTVHPAKASCPDCGRNFSTAQKMEQHREVHSIPLLDRYTFKCEYPGCNARYTKPFNLDMHVRAKHKKVTFDCKMCDVGCTTRFGLKRHYMLMHEVEEEMAVELSGQRRHKRKQQAGSSSNAENGEVKHQPPKKSKKPKVVRRKQAKNRSAKEEVIEKESLAVTVRSNPSNNHREANPEVSVQDSGKASEEPSKVIVELNAQTALPKSPKQSRRTGNSGMTLPEGPPEVKTGSDVRLKRNSASQNANVAGQGHQAQLSATGIDPDEEKFLAFLRAQANWMEAPNLFPEFGGSQSENSSSCAEEAPRNVSAAPSSRPVS